MQLVHPDMRSCPGFGEDSVAEYVYIVCPQTEGKHILVGGSGTVVPVLTALLVPPCGGRP